MSRHEGPGHRQKKIQDDAPDWYIQMFHSSRQHGLCIASMDLNGEVKFIDSQDFSKLIDDLVKITKSLNEQCRILKHRTKFKSEVAFCM